MKKIFSLSLALIMLTTSCATIVHGTRQSIGISSDPSCANVWVDNIFMGNTPVCVNLSRGSNHNIMIELEGYQPYQILCSKEMSAWVFGNIIFGGFIGLAVDALSGGLYYLTPEQVCAHLASSNCCYAKQTTDSYVAVVMEPDPSWEKIGELTPIDSSIEE